MLDERPTEGGYAVNGTSIETIKGYVNDEMKEKALDCADTGEEVKLCFEAYEGYGATAENTALYTDFTALTGTDLDNAYKAMVDYTTATVFDAINHAVILKEINSVQSPSDIISIIGEKKVGETETTYKSLLPSDLTKTFDKCDKEQLALYLGGAQDLSTMAKLKKAIDDGYKAQTGGETGGEEEDEEEESGGGFSGGGGGGGGGLSGDKLPPKEDTTPTEPQQPTQPQNPADGKVFSDIGSVDWAEEAILYLNEKEILSGDGNGKFRPNDNITREEFTKLVVVAFGIPAAKGNAEFGDVADDSWAKDYINSAFESGIVNGVSEDSFGFGTNISRQDMALMVLRAAEAMGRSFEEGEVTSTDADEIADYARDAVAKMMKAGIINGFTDGSFAPNANATRAQAAKIIYAIVKGTEVN